MFGIVYLLLGILLGKEWMGRLVLHNTGGKITAWNRLWVMLPVSFGAGTLVMGWAVYLISWAASALGAGRPLFLEISLLWGL